MFHCGDIVGLKYAFKFLLMVSKDSFDVGLELMFFFFYFLTACIILILIKILELSSCYLDLI